MPFSTCRTSWLIPPSNDADGVGAASSPLVRGSRKCNSAMRGIEKRRRVVADDSHHRGRGHLNQRSARPRSPQQQVEHVHLLILNDWLSSKPTSNGSGSSCCRAIADVVEPSRRTVNEFVGCIRRAIRGGRQRRPLASQTHCVGRKKKELHNSRKSSRAASSVSASPSSRQAG